MALVVAALGEVAHGVVPNRAAAVTAALARQRLVFVLGVRQTTKRNFAAQVALVVALLRVRAREARRDLGGAITAITRRAHLARCPLSVDEPRVGTLWGTAQLQLPLGAVIA